MNDQVLKYNEIAAAAGRPLLAIKKFESRAIGDARIKKLVDSLPVIVQPTPTIEPVSEESDVAKKVKKTNGKKKEPAGKGKLILDMLSRKSGATVDEACKATGWKTVHFSAHAKKAGLKLRKERNKEGAVRYWAE